MATSDPKIEKNPPSALPAPAKADPVPAPEKTPEKTFKSVSSNPALLEFPTDIWGFTSEIKKVVLRTAGRIDGQKDKHDLVLLTLGILAKHIVARYEGDKAEMAARLELQAKEAAARDAVTWRALGYIKDPKKEDTN